MKIKKFIFKNRKSLRGNKTNFSNIEDSLILKMYLQIGPKWKLISKMLPGRSGA